MNKPEISFRTYYQLTLNCLSRCQKHSTALDGIIKRDYLAGKLQSTSECSGA